ncbi:hypothetical protein PR048_033073 [Dryococelus australis]|uniref:Uncharacterized protein n=1 Tax=Dryococelus australis TaxID=614101 RepID=A0ABQ9FZ83_9NEOP|nr:hypothetical protein PR048_033073 [Dryococelus australis]
MDVSGEDRRACKCGVDGRGGMVLDEVRTNPVHGPLVACSRWRGLVRPLPVYSRGQHCPLPVASRGQHYPLPVASRGQHYPLPVASRGQHYPLHTIADIRLTTRARGQTLMRQEHLDNPTTREQSLPYYNHSSPPSKKPQPNYAKQAPQNKPRSSSFTSGGLAGCDFGPQWLIHLSGNVCTEMRWCIVTLESQFCRIPSGTSSSNSGKTSFQKYEVGTGQYLNEQETCMAQLNCYLQYHITPYVNAKLLLVISVEGRVRLLRDVNTHSLVNRASSVNNTLGKCGSTTRRCKHNCTNLKRRGSHQTSNGALYVGDMDGAGVNLQLSTHSIHMSSADSMRHLTGVCRWQLMEPLQHLLLNISNRQFRRFEMNFISTSSAAVNSNGATVICVYLRSDLGSSFEPRHNSMFSSSMSREGRFARSAEAGSSGAFVHLMKVSELNCRCRFAFFFFTLLSGPRSPPTKANRVRFPVARALPDFRTLELYRTMALVCGFSMGSPVSPALSFQRCSILTSITLIASQDLATVVHLRGMSACLELSSTSEAEKRGSYKGYTGTHYKYAIAATRRALCSILLVVAEMMMELSHSLTLNEDALQQIPEPKRPVFVFEWLRFLDKVLVAAQKRHIASDARCQRRAILASSQQSDVLTPPAGDTDRAAICYPARKLALLLAGSSLVLPHTEWAPLRAVLSTMDKLIQQQDSTHACDVLGKIVDKPANLNMGVYISSGQAHPAARLHPRMRCSRQAQQTGTWASIFPVDKLIQQQDSTHACDVLVDKLIQQQDSTHACDVLGKIVDKPANLNMGVYISSGQAHPAARLRPRMRCSSRHRHKLVQPAENVDAKMYTHRRTIFSKFWSAWCHLEYIVRRMLQPSVAR